MSKLCRANSIKFIQKTYNALKSSKKFCVRKINNFKKLWKNTKDACKIVHKFQILENTHTNTKHMKDDVTDLSKQVDEYNTLINRHDTDSSPKKTTKEVKFMSH